MIKRKGQSYHRSHSPPVPNPGWGPSILPDEGLEAQSTLFRLLSRTPPLSESESNVSYQNPAVRAPESRPEPADPVHVPSPELVCEVPSNDAEIYEELSSFPWEAPPQANALVSTSPNLEKDAPLASIYGASRRQLFDVLSALEDIGVKHEIDLPQIVVIGSQSVGKSSLIESMCGITLPRDSGTCTRCPMECRLQTSPAWSCQIALRFHYDDGGLPLPSPKTFAFGMAITDKSLVESRLRRAQSLILRPGLDRRFYTDPTLDLEGETESLSFSYNMVCIRVTGPDVPDLLFYDLPGIIANVGEGGDQEDISLVKRLAERYINKLNCLILLVISCETDFENQGAAHLVLPSETLRSKTIGVLTKVDRIEHGTASKWLRMLRNEENGLANGWHAVKQPNPEQLRSHMSWEEARKQETEFFSNTLPWLSLAGSVEKQLGSPNLAAQLGEMLSQLIQRSLPQIIKDIRYRKEDVVKRLEAIPLRHIVDPFVEVLELMSRFNKDVEANIEGLPQLALEPGLVQAMQSSYVTFQREVALTAPRMRPWEEHQRVSQKIIDSLRDEGESDGTCDIYYLNDIKTLMARSRTRELPGNYPFLLKASLIKNFTRRWGPLASALVNAADSEMKDHIDRLVAKHFGQFKHGGLLTSMRISMAELSSKLRNESNDAILGLLRLEERPWTLNEHYLAAYKTKMFNRYREAFLASVNPSLAMVSQPSETQTGEPALEVMADVRAYFQVSCRRFVDNVCLQIDSSLVRKYSEEIQGHINRSLDLRSDHTDKTRYKDWLAENPFVSRDREGLEIRKTRLEAAERKLGTFKQM